VIRSDDFTSKNNAAAANNQKTTPEFILADNGKLTAGSTTVESSQSCHQFVELGVGSFAMQVLYLMPRKNEKRKVVQTSGAFHLE
jgi:hypothetical protein